MSHTWNDDSEELAWYRENCAGLNPAAYREVVDAARFYLNHPHDNEGINLSAVDRLQKALTHAAGGQP